jgi:hypothetical protein
MVMCSPGGLRKRKCEKANHEEKGRVKIKERKETKVRKKREK